MKPIAEEYMDSLREEQREIVSTARDLKDLNRRMPELTKIEEEIKEVRQNKPFKMRWRAFKRTWANYIRRLMKFAWANKGKVAGGLITLVISVATGIYGYVSMTNTISKAISHGYEQIKGAGNTLSGIAKAVPQFLRETLGLDLAKVEWESVLLLVGGALGPLMYTILGYGLAPSAYTSFLSVSTMLTYTFGWANTIGLMEMGLYKGSRAISLILEEQAYLRVGIDIPSDRKVEFAKNRSMTSDEYDKYVSSHKVVSPTIPDKFVGIISGSLSLPMSGVATAVDVATDIAGPIGKVLRNLPLVLGVGATAVILYKTVSLVRFLIVLLVVVVVGSVVWYVQSRNK